MKNLTKYLKLFFALSLFFFNSLFNLIPILIFNLDVDNISSTTFSYISLFSKSLVAVILFLLYRKDIIKNIKELKNKSTLGKLQIGFNCWFIGVMVMAGSNLIINFFNPNSIAANEEAVINNITMNPVIFIFITVFLSPIIEELIFRKSFREIFKGKWSYILISGIIFGSLHVLLSPVDSIFEYLYLIPYCSLGIAFSAMYYKTNNIVIPIFFHIIHNLLNAISTLLLLGVLL